MFYRHIHQSDKFRNSSEVLHLLQISHLCTHMALNWYLYGRLKGIDTALAEHSHIEDKSTFQRTSKRMNSTQSEMFGKTSYKVQLQN